MDQYEPITVTRTLTLDATADELWRMLTEDGELSNWFTPDAAFDAVPGGTGRFGDGATVRRAVVHRVEPGRRLGFTWWPESDPTDATTVELLVEEADQIGRVQLTVVETLVPASGGLGARACSWIDAADAWDARFQALGDRISDRMRARCSLFAG